jgi:hypothetical protein
MQPITNIKIRVTEISGATFTSSTFESTIEEMVSGGHKITPEDIEKLHTGNSVTLVSYNRVGTPTKRTLRAIA